MKYLRLFIVLTLFVFCSSESSMDNEKALKIIDDFKSEITKNGNNKHIQPVTMLTKICKKHGTTYKDFKMFIDNHPKAKQKFNSLVMIDKHSKNYVDPKLSNIDNNLDEIKKQKVLELIHNFRTAIQNLPSDKQASLSEQMTKLDQKMLLDPTNSLFAAREMLVLLKKNDVDVSTLEKYVTSIAGPKSPEMPDSFSVNLKEQTQSFNPPPDLSQDKKISQFIELMKLASKKKMKDSRVVRAMEDLGFKTTDYSKLERAIELFYPKLILDVRKNPPRDKTLISKLSQEYQRWRTKS